MKAKEWTAVLRPLHVDVCNEKSGSAELFTDEVAKLNRECMDMVEARLKNQKGNYPTSVITNAFAEAEIKWNAVVHAVSDGHEVFPLVRGMLGTLFVSSMITKLKEGQVKDDYFKVYSQIIEAVAQTPTNRSNRLFQATLDEYRAIRARRVGSSHFFLEALARGMGFAVPTRR